MENLLFLRPVWFYGFFVFLLLPFLLIQRHRLGGMWRVACDWKLLQSQLVPARLRRVVLPVALLGTGWVLALVGIAGPAFEKLPQPVLKQGADTVLAADISLFMTARDVQPSRMKRTAFKMSDILKKSADGQNALILYDNEAFVAAPLTDDAAVIENILPTVEAGMMGGQAPKPAKAIEKAAEMFDSANVRHGTVVLLGAYLDAGDLGDALKAAQALKQKGHKLFVIGVGTAAGAPITLPDGSFFKIKGKPVLSGLSEDAFQTLARAGGGTYRRLSADDSDFAAYLNARENGGAPDFEKFLENQKADVYKDVGYRLAWVLLPLTALCFRRGWLAAVALVLMTTPSQAFSFKDLFVRKDVQAAQAIYDGKTAEADAFADASWKGAAQYKAQKYQESAETLNESGTAEDRYNQGNALAHAGQYQQAIDAYASVLKENPKHADAAFNKKYLEDRLKNQQNQQNQQNRGKQEQQNQQNQQQNQSQNQQNQQNQSPSEKQQAGEQKQGQSQAQEQAQERARQQEMLKQQAQEQAQNQHKKDGEKSDEKRDASQAPRPDKKEEQKKSDAKAAAAQDALPDGKKQKRHEEWMDAVEDDPSGLLRARIYMKLMQKQQNNR